ncbi:MAG: glycerate kinase [Candidatus Obscuribacterales bacterium]|nr:glycerate kinase [Candidatus Obscuribacterales bacterium]
MKSREQARLWKRPLTKARHRAGIRFTELVKYLIAPSAYKGSLSASQLAHAIASGIRRRNPNAPVDLLPIADGGDGTIEALRTALGGTLNFTDVSGAVGQPTKAVWLVLDRAESGPEPGSSPISKTAKLPDEQMNEQNDKSPIGSHRDRGSKRAPEKSPGKLSQIAIVELASACGLAALQDRLAALEANTLGIGQVLQACLDHGYGNIVVTVGGSASTDGGMGVLTALGAKFYNKAGQILPSGGAWLGQIDSIDLSALDERCASTNLQVATDVKNPLLGPEGAAHVFGPQKGASVEDVLLLEDGLRHYADRLEKTTRRTARHQPGAGAAGGTAFGMACALGAPIIPGFEWLAELIDLEERLKNADVVVSAEGHLDTQSISGKATGELAFMCRKYGKPFIMLPAISDATVDWSEYGITAVFPTAKPGRLATIYDVEKSAELINAESLRK